MVNKFENPENPQESDWGGDDSGGYDDFTIDLDESEIKYKKGRAVIIKRLSEKKQAKDVWVEEMASQIIKKNELTENPFIEVDYENPERTIFPSYMRKVAQQIFISVMQRYKEEKILNELDTSLLMVFAKAVEKYHDFEYKFSEGIYTYSIVSSTGNERESPESRMHLANINQIKNLSSLLLINPSSRKVKIEQPKSDKTQEEVELSPLERFLATRSKQ